MKRLGVLWILCWALQSPVARAAAPVILVFGDSISAGYGLPRVDQGWVALLQARLQHEGYGDEVINASVSGETTTGGLSRLPRALALHHPAVVVLELGGNDGLRALPLEAVRANLEKMINLAQGAHARVVLLGMRIPPNYGPDYAQRFAALFEDIAQKRKLPFVPFLLGRVALDPDQMQADGIHPNAAAQPVLLDAVWPVLRPLL
ncbi:MAG TPA: arylesterase [Steroidobacteraceae bacterium]|nr:arylesterase [Steroidobacteraceae bacterium]